MANSRNGIFLEISCGGTIRNNYLEGNGTDEQYPNWMGDATGILVSMTPDVAGLRQHSGQQRQRHRCHPLGPPQRRRGHQM